MKKLALGLMLALTAGPAFADPLTDALERDGGVLCFARSYDAAWLKAHRGQTLREVKLAISDDPKSGGMRLYVRDGRRNLYGYGGCEWYQGNMNRGVQNDIIDPAFKPTSGVWCHMVTDITGGSAEEGTEPMIDWRDGRTIEMHLGDGLAIWTSYDISRPAIGHELKPGNRIVRLHRVKPAECKQMIAKFAPNGLE